MELSGKLVWVTGASRGIGAAAARAFAAQGCRVLLIARSGADLETVANGIRAAKRGEAHTYSCDLSDGAAIESMVAELIAAQGVPDVVVHNAGAGRWLYADETSGEELRQMMALPFMAAFDITRLVLPEMLKRGSGAFVLVNSPACIAPWQGATGYVTARFALRGLAEALRADLSDSGITVSHCIFGKVSSDYFRANPGTEERLPAIARSLRVLTPAQAATSIVKAAKRGKPEIIRPFSLRVIRLFHRFTPGLVQKMLVRSGHKRNQDQPQGPEPIK